MAETKATDMLAMSDDEFDKLNSPAAPTAETGSETVAETKTEAETSAEVKAEAQVVTDTDGDDQLTDAEKAAQANDGEDEDEDPTLGGKLVVEDKAEAKAEAAAEGDKPAAEAKAGAEAKDKSGEVKTEAKTEAEVKTETPNYQAFYEQIMKPFKANGKLITLKDPSEAIQLMQMGANYTRKLQDLQPQRKLILMLEKNDLLDEDKLSFLIDLDRKNPEAIKKLVKDSGIDPIDIDVSENSAYRPGNHSVSDQETGFRDAMADITSTPEGKETVSEIHARWDDTSKEALWEDPKILATIHEQRESGVYALITEEMDRQITLGKIPANTPFLDAYKLVGDELVAAAQSTQQSGEQTGEATPAGENKSPTVVATRAAAPKSELANDDKAKAASSTRSSPKAAKVVVNPLAESDEAFMKRMEGRL